MERTKVCDFKDGFNQKLNKHDETPWRRLHREHNVKMIMKLNVKF